MNLDENGRPVDQPIQISHGLGLESMAFSADFSKLAYSKEERRQNVWRIPIPEPGSTASTWADASQITMESSRIQSLTLSPDGNQIYFESNRSGHWQLWKMDADGSALVQLTTGGHDNAGVHLSSDGSMLAFVSDRTGYSEIWTMPANGGPTKQITRDENPKYWPRWSPDGSLIAFHVTDSLGNPNFWIVPAAAGGEVTKLAPPTLLFYPLWAPDGNSLLSATRSPGRLLRIPLDGSAHITFVPPGVGVLPDDLHWSTDKSEVYFRGVQEAGNSQLWSYSLTNGELTQLSDLNGRPGRLGRDFETDGRYLYFTWREHLSDIWVMDVEEN